MNLALEFIRNIEGGFGEAGKRFLAGLPASIEEASQRWRLRNVQPVPTLSHNFVAFADRGHEQLGFERERIREWGLAHAVLSSWWSIEEHGDWHYASEFAKVIADLK